MQNSGKFPCNELYGLQKTGSLGNLIDLFTIGNETKNGEAGQNNETIQLKQTVPVKQNALSKAGR